jgi:NIMA (never in mitosis gene a)-related kinase
MYKSDFEFQKKIGQGNYGKVYLAINKKTKKSIVIKAIECYSDDEAEESYQEISFMDKLSSPFIVGLETNFVDGDSIFIVMEYCPNGDAGGLIKKCQQLRQHIPEPILIDLFTQICFGLNVCHSSHVLHRDIKTDNIYISKANVAKLGDFGVSRNLNSTVDMSKTMAGTP